MPRKRTIAAAKGTLPQMVDRAELVLAEEYERWRIFQSNDLLFRVTTLTKDEVEGDTWIRRQPGSVVVWPLTPVMLDDVLSQAINLDRQEDSRH